MKLQADAKELSNALSKLVKIASGNRAQEILNHVLLETGDNVLKLTANNLDMSITTSVKAYIVTPGEFTLPANKFSQIVESCKKQITLEIKDTVATIKEGKSSIKIQGIEAKDYPRVQFDSSNTVEIDSSILLNGLTKTVFAVMPSKLSGGLLSGVYLNITNNKIEFAGTDGNRLSTYEAEVNLKHSITALIPQDIVIELVKLIPKDSLAILSITKDTIYFKFNQLFITARLLEGQYPRYKQLIPQDNDNIALIDRSKLISVLKKIKIITETQTNKVSKVVFKFKDDVLSISYNSTEGQLTEELSCSYKGKELDLGFNPRYIFDVLSLIGSDQVYLKMQGSLNPVLVLPVDQDPFVNLIMPMPIN